jgi:endonuclease/exonuclease/phosphatase (EEP) superfamily protein YafD
MCFVAIILIAISLFQSIFYIPSQPEQLTIGATTQQLTGPYQPQQAVTCYENNQASPLDRQARINLLVWNIYKQNRSNWAPVLTQLSQGADLILLQEARLTPALEGWVRNNQWQGNYVKAFEIFATATGVVNLARSMAQQSCAFSAIEPWLRLPKTALFSLYRLSNGQHLAVINIHAINFSLGMEDYSQQLGTLIDALQDHDGPIVMAGDFNAWSQPRLDRLNELASSLSLRPVAFADDNRKRFIGGLALDYIFYRGLTLIDASVPITDASDHNPLVVGFSVTLEPID